MQLVLLMVVSAAALATASPALLPSDIDSRRIPIVRPPPNDFYYQSFSQTVPAYSVRLVRFQFPEDRSIVIAVTIIVSGTGFVRIISGGPGTNYVIVRAESAAQVLNYRLNVDTIPVEGDGSATDLW